MLHAKMPGVASCDGYGPSDLGAFCDHLLRLDPQSRFDRFAMHGVGRIHAGLCGALLWD